MIRMTRLGLLVSAALAQACGASSASRDAGPARTDAAADAVGDAAADAGVISDSSSGAEGGATADAPVEIPDGSLCLISAASAKCLSQQTMIGARPVAHQTPLGTPPSGGWPGVIYFQGSLVPGTDAFSAASTAAFGQYDLTLTVAALLADGYAVIAPDAASDGTTFWDTNIPPYATSWSGCPDDLFMQALFTALSSAAFGPINTTRLYAMGISSGGFMTSRMAVSYQGKFRALADHSGSYATCSDTCTVPTPLPANHPPTLFLHGDTDTIVPLSAIQPYIDALMAGGFQTQLVTDVDAGHQWLPQGRQVIPAWFDSHP
jgi:poly(3-hydroxybutyrate) depolymerase